MEAVGVSAFVADDGKPGFRFQSPNGNEVSVQFSPYFLNDLRQLIGALEAMVAAGKTGLIY